MPIPLDNFAYGSYDGETFRYRIVGDTRIIYVNHLSVDSVVKFNAEDNDTWWDVVHVDYTESESLKRVFEIAVKYFGKIISDSITDQRFWKDDIVKSELKPKMYDRSKKLLSRGNDYTGAVVFNMEDNWPDAFFDDFPYAIFHLPWLDND